MLTMLDHKTFRTASTSLQTIKTHTISDVAQLFRRRQIRTQHEIRLLQLGDLEKLFRDCIGVLLCTYMIREIAL